MSPRVSVIMTVRNGARYLPETLDALAAQTLSDLQEAVLTKIPSFLFQPLRQ